MSGRNILALIFIIISLICLYPGLTAPMLTIKVGISLPIIGEQILHDTTQSILSTIKTLFDNDNSLVAFLILLFSVVVPVLKALILLAVLFMKPSSIRRKLYEFVAAIGKWSMADVFIVGVFLSQLATKSDDGIDAFLHEGFYYFVAYCIISLIGIMLIHLNKEEYLAES